MNRYPLLPIAAAFAAGIGTAPRFHLTAIEQLWLITASTLLAALLLWRSRNTAAFLACCLGLFLCGTFFAAAEHAYRPPHHLDRLVQNGRIQPAVPLAITGWARAPVQRRPGSETLDIAVEEVRQSGRVLPASGGVRLYHFSSETRLASLDIGYGTRLTVSLESLRRPRNFLTPDSFDWEGYLRRQAVAFTGRVRGTGDFQIRPGRAGNPWSAAVHRLRSRLLETLDRFYAAPEGITERGAILKAMLLGDDRWLSRQRESRFQASGTYHILVVSGWNVFAFAVPLLWLVGRLRLPDWLGTLLVAAAVAGFAMLAVGGAAVSRAALMFLIYLLARYFYRQRAALNAIAAAALILLVLRPSDLWDTGFQLSFFAVLILAAVAVPLSAWIATPYREALRGLADRGRDRLLQPRQIQFRHDLRVLQDFLFGTGDPKPGATRQWLRAASGWGAWAMAALFEGLLFTAMIQAGLFVMMLLYFNRLTWSGIVSNLLILPLASSIVMIGLPVLFLSQLWWPLGQAGAGLLGWMATLLQWVVDAAAQWDWLNRRLPAPPSWLSLAILAVLVILALLIARRSRWTVAAVAALTLCCVVVSLAPYRPLLSSGRLELAVLDVGQGDSIFISFPDGTTMLVDGGGAIPLPGAPPPRLDIGEGVVSAYLWSRRIQKLDIVVLTHNHWDHMGGLPAVLRNFRVGELWLGPDPEDRNLDWLRSIAAARGTRVVSGVPGAAGNTKRSFGGVEVKLLSPPADWTPRRVSNNDSIVMQLRYGQRQILLPGDVEARMERRLVQQGESLRSDVLKVAHHGSRTSTTEEFLKQVAPGFGIISVGAFGRFGHPHAEVLETLRHAGVRIYRTDRDGTTTASTDGHRLEISAYRDSLRPWPRFAP